MPHSLAELDFLPILVLDRYLISLIPRGPDNEIRRLQMLCLVLWRRALNKLHPLLNTFGHTGVKPLGVTSQASVGVNEAMWVRENLFAELLVTCLLGLINSAEKDPNLVSVENFDARLTEPQIEIILIVESPIFPIKVPEALTNTIASSSRFLLLAGTALDAISHTPERCVWETRVLRSRYRCILVIRGWTV